MGKHKFVKGWFFLLLAGMLLVLTAGSHTASAAGATHWVNDDDPNGGGYTPPGRNCNDAGYQTIQAAVDAAAPGDRINVCPGTYPEQVTIPAGKNNLTLRSLRHRQATIQAPPVMADPGDIVHVAGATNVTIQGFIIRGPLPDALFCSTFARTGIRVDGGGSARIVKNHITEIRSASESLRGCQNGVAILVGRAAEGQVGSATIQDNLIDKYQKNGPTVSNSGSSALIKRNAIYGIGPTDVIAQNGVQVSSGATARVIANAVRDHTYSLAPNWSSTGILLFEAGSGVQVDENDLQRNDDNVGVYTTSGARIVDNRITTSTFYDGVYMASDTANNTIRENFLRDNAEHDCHDDSTGGGTAGTANFWTDNDGVTENRPGLCTDDDDLGLAPAAAAAHQSAPLE